MTEPEPMTTEDLERFQIGPAGVGELIAISPGCHEGEPIHLAYSIDGQCLVVICSVCRSLVTKIRVASCPEPEGIH